MSLFVKICGLTDVAGIDAAVAAGADALGFVFAESVRRISPIDAAALTADVPESVCRVAVMRHPSLAQWRDVEEVFAPDWLQTDVDDFSALQPLGAVRRIPVYRDSPELDADQLRTEGIVVFEAADSGRGMLADWDLARRLAATVPLILAGGLTPDNVADAVATVRPWGVDVSSGVERSRGVKDPARIAAFVEAAREAEQQNAD